MELTHEVSKALAYPLAMHSLRVGGPLAGGEKEGEGKRSTSDGIF